MGTMAERLDELLLDAAYSNAIQSSGLSAEAYYLQNTWDDDLLDGNAPDPDEILQALAGLDSSELISVVSSLDISQFEELDSVEGFDLAETLTTLDPTLLGEMGIFEIMAGDVDFFQGIFDPNEMLFMLGGAGDMLASIVHGMDASNLAFLDGAEGFDLGATLAGLDPAMLADFDIYGKMAGDMDAFQGFMDPSQMLSIFGGAGDMLTELMAGMDASNLAFLDGAEGFDLGATLAVLDPAMLGGFMSGWGGDELQFLDGLDGFDLGSTMAGFDPEMMASMMGSWDDPSAISFLGGLDDFDFGAMLNDMPDNLKGEMLGHMDGSVLAGLGDLGGDFDLTTFVAGAGDFLPEGFDLNTAMDGGGTGGGFDLGSGGTIGGFDLGGGGTISGFNLGGGGTIGGFDLGGGSGGTISINMG